MESVEKNKCKICISLGSSTFPDLLSQIKLAVPLADLVEIRLDKLDQINLEKLHLLKENISCLLIWTLRKASHGGEFLGTEEERLNLLRSILLNIQPDFMDLEGDIPKEVVEEFQTLSPRTKWIISWHDIKETPQNLDSIYQKISALPASYYKIAVQAQSTIDAIRMLKFSQRMNQSKSHVCGICMGEHGQITRILSPMIKQPFTYASLEKNRETAPGQISASELILTYRFREINPTTQLLGLIGRPVDKSYSHITHNAVLKKLSINAIYLKFHLQEEEFFSFFNEIQALPVIGLSVTMPFKEKVLELIEKNSDLSSCNTLVSASQRWLGYNTDGVGVLRALNFSSFKNTKAIILGAGGTAKAIAKALYQQGAHLAILNRTVERAKNIAIPLKARWGGLDLLPVLTEEGYDCVIQATSVGMAPALEESPIQSDWIAKEAVVLDVISNPSETRLLREVKNRGGKTISGKELFIHQAVEQFICWFDSEPVFTFRLNDLCAKIRSICAKNFRHINEYGESFLHKCNEFIAAKHSSRNCEDRFSKIHISSAISKLSDKEFRNWSEEIEATIRQHLP